MRVVGLITAGVVWWTLLEYLLHRFAFHERGRLFGKRHLAHHAEVTKRSLAIAPWPSMLGGAGLHAVVVFGFCPVSTAAPLFGAFLIGYVAYEWTHYSTHYRVARTGVGRFLRAYHLAHHHRSPKARFGVTSPFWDMVFGTYEPVARGASTQQAPRAVLKR